MTGRRWIFNAWFFGLAFVGGVLGFGLTVVLYVLGWYPDSPSLSSIVGMVCGAGGVIAGLAVSGHVGFRMEFRRRP